MPVSGVPTPDLATPVRPSRLTGALAAVVLVAAALVLIGWLADVRALTSVLPGLATMKFNTALCLGLLAIALLAPDRVRRVLLVVVAGIALYTLTEYLLGAPAVIDELVVDDPNSAGKNPPGRMAQVTALSLICLATAQLLEGSPRRRARLARDVGLGFAFGAGALAALGYLYGVESLYAVAGFSTMAVNTAGAVLALSVATEARSPGLVSWLIADETLGAQVLRRLGAVTLIVLPLIGFLQIWGRDAGLYGERFGSAVLVLMTAASILTTGIVLARRLDTADAARRQATTSLERLNESLVSGRDEAWERAESLAVELAEEQRLFESAIGRIDDFVWTVEVTSERRVELVYASPNGEGVFGGRLPQDGDVAGTMAAMVHPDDLPANALFNEKVTSGRAAGVELRLIGLDGLTRWVWARGVPRYEDDRLFFDGITTNIEERRQVALERERLLVTERRQREELEELDRLKDEFLAVAGHELRTPITVISGYADLLSADPTLSHSQLKHATTIQRRSRDLERLAQDLFDLAQFSIKRVEIRRETVDLGRLALECGEAAQGSAQAKDIRLEVHTDSAAVTGDPARLRQVIGNLVGNAVKYTPEHGTVRVAAGVDGQSAIVTVSDTGIGVPANEVEDLFQRFFRATTARESDVSGTGLGLSVARTLVEAHDGTITAQRNQGAGMTFTVTLPVRPSVSGP